MSRTTILVLVLVFLLGGAVLLFRDSEPVQEIITWAEQIALTGHRDDGSPAWFIQAESGSLDEDNGMLETVELTFFRESAAPIVVHGDRLARDSGGSTLSGSIVVKQAETLSLETETIYWDERNDVLESGLVTVEMESASIEAGAFHHDLGSGLTTLTQGIEAQLIQNDDEYVVRSDSAEATSDQLALIGNVSIQSATGNTYSCQRLESEPSGSSIRLIEEVSGMWQESAFSAGIVQLDADGIRLLGDVIIDLDLLMMDEPHDA